MQSYDQYRKYVIIDKNNSNSVLYKGTSIPTSLKKDLKTNNNLIRFDSVGEYDCYRKLCRVHGKDSIKIHYRIIGLNINWLVDFKVINLYYEYKCNPNDKRFLTNLQVLANYYPKIIKSLIIVSPNISRFEVKSKFTDILYTLNCIKIEDI